MFRIGFSRDIHRLEKNGRPFVLGGVSIPHDRGNVSHSDGDCLFHAIGEALLGTLSLGDLGHFFPDDDARYKDMDSALILRECFLKIKERGYAIQNLDCVIVLEKPHLKAYLGQMRAKISSILETEEENISVKAQTNEKCGEAGQGEAVICFASVLVKKIQR